MYFENFHSIQNTSAEGFVTQHISDGLAGPKVTKEHDGGVGIREEDFNPSELKRSMY